MIFTNQSVSHKLFSINPHEEKNLKKHTVYTRKRPRKLLVCEQTATLKPVIEPSRSFDYFLLRLLRVEDKPHCWNGGDDTPVDDCVKYSSLSVIEETLRASSWGTEPAFW